MPNTDDFTGWVVSPEDDDFHEASDHPWETETFWTSFSVPERKMSGWFYNQVLANQGETGICNGGAFVWSDEDTDPYTSIVKGLPMARSRSLNDILLPNGNHIQTLEPLKLYRVRRNDPGRFECDLHFAAIMEPNPHPAGVWPFIKGRHFDQAMHVTGEIVLNGEKIAIDSLSVRDRSWSPRPPASLNAEKPKETDSSKRRPRRGVGYVFGTSSSKDAFLAYSSWTEEEAIDSVDTGYLVKDGVWAHLVRGERRCLVDPERDWIWHIEVEAVDSLGRTLSARGSLVSHQGAKGPGNGLFHWDWGGVEGWGENQGGSASFYSRRPQERLSGAKI